MYPPVSGSARVSSEGTTRCWCLVGVLYAASRGGLRCGCGRGGPGCPPLVLGRSISGGGACRDRETLRAKLVVGRAGDLRWMKSLVFCVSLMGSGLGGLDTTAAFASLKYPTGRAGLLGVHDFLCFASASGTNVRWQCSHLRSDWLSQTWYLRSGKQQPAATRVAAARRQSTRCRDTHPLRPPPTHMRSLKRSTWFCGRPSMSLRSNGCCGSGRRSLNGFRFSRSFHFFWHCGMWMPRDLDPYSRPQR